MKKLLIVLGLLLLAHKVLENGKVITAIVLSILAVYWLMLFIVNDSVKRD